MKTKTKTFHGSRADSGASIIVVLFLATAIGLMVASFFRLANTGYNLSTRALLSNAALNLAEAGADEAIWALNKDDWSTWEESGDFAAKTVSDFDLGSNKSGTYSVVVEDYKTAPTVYVEGRVQTSTGMESFRQLKIELSGRSLFSNGMVAITQLTLGGDGDKDTDDKDKDSEGDEDKDEVDEIDDVDGDLGDEVDDPDAEDEDDDKDEGDDKDKDSDDSGSSGIMVDSYDSAEGAYDVFLNRTDNISVASPSTEEGSVNINNAEVYGYVGTGGGDPDMDDGAQVHGTDTPSEIQVDPNRVTADFAADYPDVDAPSMSSPYTALPAPDESGIITIGTGGTSWAPEEYHLTELSLGGNDILLIDGPVTLRIDNNVETSGKSEIRIGNTGSASIFFEGDADFGGGGIVNATQIPSTFILYSTSTDTSTEIRLRGNSDLFAAIYAPSASIKLTGNTDVFGSLIGNTISVSGNADFHYDEQLSSFSTEEISTTYGMTSWRELVQNSEQVDFASYLGE